MRLKKSFLAFTLAGAIFAQSASAVSIVVEDNVTEQSGYEEYSDCEAYADYEAYAADSVQPELFAVTRSDNEEKVYDFLIKSGFNSAAACGIMANIQSESYFNPNCVGDNGTSYGLCQWHNDRWDRLKEYSPKTWKTVEGQLEYLSYELKKFYPKVYNYITSVDNTAQGAYDAAYYWCYYFEIPANRPVVSVNRGNLAKNTYWPEYHKDTTSPNISGVSISDLNSEGYTVKCRVADDFNVSSVKFTVWTKRNGKDDVVTKKGTISGNNVSFKVRTADHNGENNATYITRIYAEDNSGNVSSKRVEAFVDNKAPVISDVKVAAADGGYKVTCTVSDNGSIDRVMFPTWTEKNGQDDLVTPWENAKQYKGTIDGDKVSFFVKTADHKNETGVYLTKIHAYDKCGNKSAAKTDFCFDLTDSRYWNVAMDHDSFVYSGKEHKPELSIKYGKTKLSEGRDYTVKYTDNVNAGTGLVTVKANGVFSGTVKKTFTVEKAKNNITINDMWLEYSGDEQKRTIKAKADNNASISYMSNANGISANADGTLTVKSGFAGMAKLTAAAEETRNHSGVSKTIGVYVRPSQPQITESRNATGSKMKVSWNNEGKVRGYQLEYSADKEFANKKQFTLLGDDGSYMIRNLKKGRYYVRMRSYIKQDGKAIFSKWTKAESVRIEK